MGGAERVLYEQSVGLAQRKHNIHILTRKLSNHDHYNEIIKGVKEWRYDYRHDNPAVFIKTTWLNTKRLFENLYQKYRFDCINFHQPFSTLGVNHSKISAGVPKIYTCHSLSFEEFISRNTKRADILNKILNYFQIIVRKKIEKIGLNKSDKIVTLSKFTKIKLIDIYGIPEAKIHVIPGGIDLERFHPDYDKTEIRAKLNIPENRIVLFTVRNLVQRMGLENLIKAFFYTLKTESADIHLVIGGNGPLKNELVALVRSLRIEQKVYFTGFIPEDQLPMYYQMADIFVLPSKELEGFGLVTLEAMACGLPVIGTPVGGTKEILENFDSSFLFHGTDSNSIAELILKNYRLIKHNPQRWKEISKRCRSFVELNYSWEKNLDTLEELFKKTLQN